MTNDNSIVSVVIVARMGGSMPPDMSAPGCHRKCPCTVRTNGAQIDHSKFDPQRAPQKTAYNANLENCRYDIKNDD